MDHRRRCVRPKGENTLGGTYHLCKRNAGGSICKMRSAIATLNRQLDEIRRRARKSQHFPVLKNLSWRLESYHRENFCRARQKTTLTCPPLLPMGNQRLFGRCFDSVSRNPTRGAPFAFLKRQQRSTTMQSKEMNNGCLSRNAFPRIYQTSRRSPRLVERFRAKAACARCPHYAT
jgi:hypothetical protein